MSVRRLILFVSAVLLLPVLAAGAKTYVVVVEKLPSNVELTFGFFSSYVKDLQLDEGVMLTCTAAPRSQGSIGFKVTDIKSPAFRGLDSVKARLTEGVLLFMQGDASEEFEIMLGIYPLEKAVELPVEKLRQSTFLVTHEITKIVDMESFITRSSENVSTADPLPDVDDFTEVEREPEFDFDRLGRMVVYPMLAQRNSMEGQVLVGALIGKDGIVERVQVIQTDAAIFNTFAMKPIILTKFIPAIAEGRPTRVWVRIPIKFTLK